MSREKKAFEKYCETINNMCRNCEYKDCPYRGRRANLKMQKINHRDVMCQKEYDIWKKNVMSKKLK